MVSTLAEGATNFASAMSAGLKKCEHPNAEVTPPCCDGRACACNGMYTVDCQDCTPSEIPSTELDTLINDFIRDEREEC